MMNKSVVDDMKTDEALHALHQLILRKAINQFDATTIVNHVIRRAEFSEFQLARLQAGLDCYELLAPAIDLVLKDRELNAAIKRLKELNA